jgi:hypothetical protein
MELLDDIRAEIERLIDYRAELLHSLNDAHDPTVAAEHKAVDERIAELWAAHRQERARLRFGERDEIIKRARSEERLERAA